MRTVIVLWLTTLWFSLENQRIPNVCRLTGHSVNLRSNGAIRVSNEGQNTFWPSYHNYEPWGTVIGSIYAQKYPEDVKCYISISQITNLYENKLDIARLTLEQKEIKVTKDEEEQQSTLPVMEKYPISGRYGQVLLPRIWILKISGAGILSVRGRGLRSMPEGCARILRNHRSSG